MDESQPPFGRRLPAGLLVALLLVATIEHEVARRALDFTRPDKWDWRLSARASTREARSAAVLALGSSLIRLGFVPQAIEPTLNAPAYNLGLCAGSPLSSYYLLRRALQAGARPRVVLVEFHPGMLGESPWLTQEYWPELLDTRETLDLAWQARDARFFGRITAARCLPAWKDRHEIRRAVTGALRGETVSEAEGVRAVQRNVARNRGAKLDPPRPDAAQRPLPDEATPWICTSLNERYIDRFLDLAASHGIRVLWLRPPVRADLQMRRAARGDDARYQQFASAVLSRHRHVHLVDATRAAMPFDRFIDPQHLDRDGALLLSAALAPTLRDAAQGTLSDAQVLLTLPLALPEAIAVEDLAASTRAVRSRTRR